MELCLIVNEYCLRMNNRSLRRNYIWAFRNYFCLQMTKISFRRNYIGAFRNYFCLRMIDRILCMTHRSFQKLYLFKWTIEDYLYESYELSEHMSFIRFPKRQAFLQINKQVLSNVVKVSVNNYEKTSVHQKLWDITGISH